MHFACSGQTMLLFSFHLLRQPSYGTDLAKTIPCKLGVPLKWLFVHMAVKRHSWMLLCHWFILAPEQDWCCLGYAVRVCLPGSPELKHGAQFSAPCLCMQLEPNYAASPFLPLRSSLTRAPVKNSPLPWKQGRFNCTVSALKFSGRRNAYSTRSCIPPWH